MDKYEIRRLRLIELRDKHCDGLNRVLADKLGRADSYISRMLYPAGKSGRKRIADDMIEVIEKAFGLPRAWLDTPIGDRTDISAVHKEVEETLSTHDYKTIDKTKALVKVFTSLCHALDMSVDEGILAILTSNKSGKSPMENNPYKEIAAKIKQQQDQLRESIPRLAEKAMGAQTQDTRKVSGSK